MRRSSFLVVFLVALCTVTCVDAGYSSAPDDDDVECDETKKTVVKAKEEDCDGPPRIPIVEDINRTFENKYTTLQEKALEILSKFGSHTVDAYQRAVLAPKSVAGEDIAFIAGSVVLLFVLITAIRSCLCPKKAKQTKAKGD